MGVQILAQSLYSAIDSIGVMPPPDIPSPIPVRPCIREYLGIRLPILNPYIVVGWISRALVAEPWRITVSIRP
ncbi:MAG: hypothetical protein ABIM59_08145 [candidate division WOR-3 bacterium]